MHSRLSRVQLLIVTSGLYCNWPHQVKQPEAMQLDSADRAQQDAGRAIAQMHGYARRANELQD